MAQLCNLRTAPVDRETEIDGHYFPDELDLLPLVQRRELLLDRIRTKGKPVAEVSKEHDSVENLACGDDLDLQSLFCVPSVPSFGEMIDQPPALQPNCGVGVCSVVPSVTHISGEADQCQQYDTGCLDFRVGGDETSLEETKVDADVVPIHSAIMDHFIPTVDGMVKVDTFDGTLFKEAELFENLAVVKVEHFDGQLCSLRDGLDGSTASHEHSMKHETNISGELSDDLDHVALKDRLRKLLPEKSLRSSQSVLAVNPNVSTANGRLVCLPANVDSLSPAPTSHLFKVKAEPLENTSGMDSTTVGRPFGTAAVKIELHNPRDPHEDDLDHMQFCERIKLKKRGIQSVLDTLENSESSKVFLSLGADGTADLEAQPLRILRSQKKRKTITDSVETALEEDAPGLLQVLVEQGVSIDEIKLYGENDCEEPIDESFIEHSFVELEDVLSKLLFQRKSFLKFAHVRCTKGSKPTYCLGCLFSLVEQARYLRFRNWPVEWGWCRELQSFIFVFERHNRIVLERPEYGYATYFFELVDSVPIDWQIKRLVTAMKLTGCGRINIIENKVLSVGEDLSEGEAKVLMQFGWTPNSGLGTMLNYCDRVVHDRKNERDTSEWKSKIGKLLTNGFNGGSKVPTNFTDNRDPESPQVKWEF